MAPLCASAAVVVLSLAATGCAEKTNRQRQSEFGALVGEWRKDYIPIPDEETSPAVPTTHVFIFTDKSWHSLVFFKPANAAVQWEFDGSGSWRVEGEELLMENDQLQSPVAPSSAVDRWRIVRITAEELALTQDANEPLVWTRGTGDMESWVRKALAKEEVRKDSSWGQGKRRDKPVLPKKPIRAGSTDDSAE